MSSRPIDKTTSIRHMVADFKRDLQPQSQVLQYMQPWIDAIEFLIEENAKLRSLDVHFDIAVIDRAIERKNGKTA